MYDRKSRDYPAFSGVNKNFATFDATNKSRCDQCCMPVFDKAIKVEFVLTVYNHLYFNRRILAGQCLSYDQLFWKSNREAWFVGRKIFVDFFYAGFS